MVLECVQKARSPNGLAVEIKRRIKNNELGILS